MLNIRGKPNTYKIQGLLFWTNLAAITEECFLWLLLCSLPFIYIEQKANNIFLPCCFNCLQMVQNSRVIRLDDRLLSSTEEIECEFCWYENSTAYLSYRRESSNYKILEKFVIQTNRRGEKKIKYKKILSSQWQPQDSLIYLNQSNRQPLCSLRVLKYWDCQVSQHERVKKHRSFIK